MFMCAGSSLFIAVDFIEPHFSVSDELKARSASANKKVLDAQAVVFYHHFQHWKGGDSKIYEF